MEANALARAGNNASPSDHFIANRERGCVMSQGRTMENSNERARKEMTVSHYYHCVREAELEGSGASGLMTD